MPEPYARPEVAAARFDEPPMARRVVQRRVGRARLGLLLAAAALVLTGCGKKVEPVEEVRPVRLMQLSPAQGRTDFEFSGEVRPRIESRLGFRVGGKIAARLVDVGASVRKGQPLARLDPTDLALAETGARAQFDAAKTDRDLAAADLKRYKELAARTVHHLSKRASAPLISRHAPRHTEAPLRLDARQPRASPRCP